MSEAAEPRLHRRRRGRSRAVLAPQRGATAGARRARVRPRAARDRGHLDDLPARQRPVPELGQPVEPDPSDRGRGDDLDRRRARAAARRDRPLGRSRERPRRLGDGRFSAVKNGWSPELAILAGLLVGTAIGLFNGFMVTIFGIPSFVVTLAGLLGWQGMQLLVLGDTGSINLPDNTITDLTGTFFDPAVGWIFGLGAIAAYVGAQLLERRRRAAAGLEVAPLIGAVIRIVLVAAAIVVAVMILNDDRGVPLAIVIVIALTALFAWITERTRYGRHIFAVGGNTEAARRAGIPINKIKVSVFALASTLAAAGGVLAASRLLAVNQQSGSGDVLLLAIAGPVIAGTSLFGGRGSVWSALLGAIVIGSISNGMDLLGLESDVKFMITGAVLLAAVTIDAIARRSRQAG